MENKYYTPAIGDIRIDYECEVRNPGRDWLKETILEKDRLYLGSFVDFVKAGDLRTPHLTKEQIEAEGWNKIVELSADDGLAPFFTFRKVTEKGKEYEVRWWGAPDYIEIYYTYKVGAFLPTDKHKRTEWDCIYQGTCPSINEFRQIIKLLGIDK